MWSDKKMGKVSQLGKWNRHWAALILIVTVMLVAILPATLVAQDRAPHVNQIAFTSNRDGNDFEIYLMDADTGEVFAQLTDNTFNDLGPTWSPDGTHIAFASDVDGDYEIYSLDVGTGESLNLTNNTAEDLYPSWSPNGRQIAFTSNRDRNWEIYVMDTGGKNFERLTNEAIYDGNPSWSPDGSQIAFVKDRDSKREVWIMGVDGKGEAQQLTDNTFGDYGPAWSPNARQNQLAYVSNHDNQGGRPEIYLLNLPCSDAAACEASAQNLTNLPTTGDLDPSWSPDGSQIVFASGRDSSDTTGNSDLYIMDANGGNVRRLTDDPADDRFPAWWSAQ
jgi:Tol biopolymer transport system component